VTDAVGGPSADQHIDPNTLRVFWLLPKKKVAQINISTDVQFGFQSSIAGDFYILISIFQLVNLTPAASWFQWESKSHSWT